MHRRGPLKRSLTAREFVLVSEVADRTGASVNTTSVHDECIPQRNPDPDRLCQSIDWYAEGQVRTVEVNGVRVAIRFVGRHGRRARIAITAPTGAIFLSTSSG